MNKENKTVAVLLAALVSIGAVSGVYYNKTTKKIENTKKQEIFQKANALSDENEANLDSFTMYQYVHGMALVNENTEPVSVDEFKGRNIVFTYWDSEFEDSKTQALNADKMSEIAASYPDTEFILIHRLDSGNPEVLESAKTFMEENGISAKILYDLNSAVSTKFKFNTIPATFAVNKDGKLVYLKEGILSDDNEIKALFDEVSNHPYTATEKYLTENLMDSSGGVIISNSDEEKNTVLSESEGILMEYAVKTGNDELYQKTKQYVDNIMKENPLVSWRVVNDKAASVNALIDDLRIYGAMYDYTMKNNGDEQELKDYSDQILEYNTDNKGRLVNFYDFAEEIEDASGKKVKVTKHKDTQLTLCFADFTSLGKLWAENWKFKPVYYKALDTVKGGYISESFPLYYSAYNYETEEYSKDDLNTAEALKTVLHLAEISEARQESINWIKENVKQGTLYGKYGVDGQAREDSKYESTACYAIAALIGKEVNDPELVNIAVKQMEKLKVNNPSSPHYGAFGNSDGTNILSFDQCMALLAYAVVTEK